MIMSKHIINFFKKVDDTIDFLQKTNYEELEVHNYPQQTKELVELKNYILANN